MNNIASFNIRGTTKAGARGEVERWMRRGDIKNRGSQEAGVKQNTREARRQRARVFSGERGKEEYAAGTAIAMYSSFSQYIQNIIGLIH